MVLNNVWETGVHHYVRVNHYPTIEVLLGITGLIPRKTRGLPWGCLTTGFGTLWVVKYRSHKTELEKQCTCSSEGVNLMRWDWNLQKLGTFGGRKSHSHVQASYRVWTEEQRNQSARPSLGRISVQIFPVRRGWSLRQTASVSRIRGGHKRIHNTIWQIQA